MKKVRITPSTFYFSTFIILRGEQFLRGKEIGKAVHRKVTVEKRLKRAGATPLFCGQAAQKFGGVAPARSAVNRAALFSTATEVRP